MQMNKTILAFEDDPQVRQLFCSFLRRLGYEARTASDGATALGLARTAAPDLVVLDVDLPDGSGFDLCRVIKSRPDLVFALFMRNRYLGAMLVIEEFRVRKRDDVFELVNSVQGTWGSDPVLRQLIALMERQKPRRSL
jgi:DNA-binding response OmpR family regulator